MARSALDAAVRWTGIPEGFEGSIQFGPNDRPNLMVLLMMVSEYGWNVTHDLFVVPDHATQYLWLDHEDVAWVFFSDPASIGPFVDRMAAAGFERPKTAPSGIKPQDWMQG